jgi:hypothetical protein
MSWRARDCKRHCGSIARPIGEMIQPDRQAKAREREGVPFKGVAGEHVARLFSDAAEFQLIGSRYLKRV